MIEVLHLLPTRAMDLVPQICLQVNLSFRPTTSESCFCWAKEVAKLRFSNLVPPLAIRMTQQRERHIWAGKREIFRPLRWDLWNSDWRTRKWVIHASVDGDLKQLRPSLWNILAFAIRWLDSETATFLFSSVTQEAALTRLKRFKTASHEQQRIRQESKESQFYSWNIKV